MRSRRLSTLFALIFAPCPLAADSLSAGGYHAVRATAGAVLGLGDGTYGQLGTNPSGSPAHTSASVIGRTSSASLTDARADAKPLLRPIELRPRVAP